MKIEFKKVILIKQYFDTTENIDGLADLLNFVGNTLYEKTFSKKQLSKKLLTFFAFKKEDKYQRFTIKKKSGENRFILAPHRYLKLIQKCLNVVLNVVFEPHWASHGFVLDKNIVTNARKHIGKNYVLNVDLEDFFPSISFRRVKTVLQLPPFNLNDELAFLIANLCCYENSLPQGAPTSPTLSNIVCQKLDRKLARFAKENRVSYSRYADDITFSARTDLFDEDFLNRLKEIILSENFKVNENKTRIQSFAQRQIVTGLTVNQKVNVSQQYIKEIRAILNNWEKKGFEQAQYVFIKNYIKDNPNIKNPSMIEVLRGKLNFLGMVRKKDNLYQKYFNQFNKLLDSYNQKEEGDIIYIKNVLSKYKTETNTSKTNRDVRKSCKHNPIRVTEFLRVFSEDRNFGLNMLVHEAEDIDLEEKLKEINLEFAKYGKQFEEEKYQIPIWLYTHIKKDLIDLYNGKGLSIYRELGKHPFQNDREFTKTIFDFKKTYRFGQDKGEETSLRDTIIRCLSKVRYGDRDILSKFQIAVFEPINQLDFDLIAAIKTDVIRVELAIRIILSSYLKHSNGSGRLKFELQEIQNQIILNIIDLDSICTKNYENLQGGDFNEIIQKLWSLCDVNVISKFKDGKTRIVPILPENKDSKLYDKEVEGFTFQLVFYNLPRVLLLDNKGRVKEVNNEYKPYIAIESDISENDLLRYNALIIHKSIPNYVNLFKRAIKENIPVVSSGGGSGGEEGIVENVGNISIAFDLMQKNLPLFLKKIKEDYVVDINIFLFANKINYKKAVKIKEEIINIIENHNLLFPELSLEVINKIKVLAKSNDIPSFENKKSLSKFLQEKLKLIEYETAN
ncbi:MAG: RNA-directed DNA polymerase [Cytophagales bacterium]|nr:MAG: RNA-directed DNA polymerase [Cytophagales bacterium]